MNEPFANESELRSLLNALCEEAITPEQRQRLEQLVLTHPEAEAYYVQFMSLHADLIAHFGVLPARLEQSLRERLQAEQPRVESKPTPEQGAVVPAATVPFSRRRRSFLWGVVAMGGLAAAVLIAVLLRPTSDGIPRIVTAQTEPEATDNTVAVLLQAPGAEWEENSLPTRAGAPLAPGWLRLKSGLAHIEFYSGATVILQAPAALQLVSRTKAYCEHGKLRATVPYQAHGFTISSPKLDLVDRGTEFGLEVGAGAKTEVHVFEGKVDLFDPGADLQAAAYKELKTGESVRLEDSGVLKAIRPTPDAFLTAQELARRTREETRRRQQDWLAASQALRQDPSLLVYYDFQGDIAGSRTLADQAGAAKTSHDGAIVGCSWVSGRWPGRHGLEFKRVSDRVRFRVPGDLESITLMAWVRVDALPNRNNSLMMTDGWDEGELHWQIGDTGMLILGVQSRPKGKGAHYHAPGNLITERFGQWVHLAVVYDRDNSQVTHYVDGRPAAQLSMQFDIPLRIGEAELGNWNLASHRNSTPVRYFTGSMDEFMLFSRALDDDEVERLYKQGRPPM
jgi:hypothetical protein